MIRRNDVVVDIGAGIGEFAIMASKRVGEHGIVIAVEPNPEDFEIMKMNVEENGCRNIVALNIGIGKEVGERDFTFYSRKFTFKVRTLRQVYDEFDIGDKTKFMKMDIEGTEVEIIHQGDIDLFENVHAIALELHDTREQLDKVLVPLGFGFKPITMGYIRGKILENILFHPLRSYRAYNIVKTQSANTIQQALGGLAVTKDRGYLVGTYVRAT